jgi:hypothetical protein
VVENLRPQKTRAQDDNSPSVAGWAGPSEDEGFAGENLDVNAKHTFGAVTGRVETVGTKARS